MDAIKDNAYSAPPMTAPPVTCAYTVGNNSDGDTVFKIGGDGYTTTLTMKPDAVRHLIRMLSTSILENSNDNTNQETA